MLYAGSDNNTDQDAGGVETPMATTQVLQNTSCTKPERLADFKAYLHVIIKSPRHFQDFDSALYD